MYRRMGRGPSDRYPGLGLDHQVMYPPQVTCAVWAADGPSVLLPDYLMSTGDMLNVVALPLVRQLCHRHTSARYKEKWQRKQIARALKEIRLVVNLGTGTPGKVGKAEGRGGFKRSDLRLRVVASCDSIPFPIESPIQERASTLWAARCYPRAGVPYAGERRGEKRSDLVLPPRPHSRGSK